VKQPIDVVIRTEALPERRGSLQRAIRSVFEQRGVAARPVVVLAGEHSCLPTELAGQPGVRMHIVGEQASPGCALGIGRRFVNSDFYAFLDDDDELLPHALSTGLELLQAEPAVDLVVTTGYWMSGGERRIHIPDIGRHQDDAVDGILERCWLHPGGGLFRASTIRAEDFENLPDLCEWTYLAFKLALDGRDIRFLDIPTYVAYDTPRSASKSHDFPEAIIEVLERIRAFALPAATRNTLEEKYRAALHNAAEHYRRAKQLGKAWRFHLMSLKPPFTLRYLAYTRKLVRQPSAVKS